MGYRAIWTSWLGLMIHWLCVNAAIAIPPDSSLQQEAAARVPLGELPEGLRARVRQVIERPTLFSHGPAEAFTGKPALYSWLLDHPDRGVLAWRRLGATCTDITECSTGRFVWKDGQGSEINWQTIHNAPSLRIWYAEGKMRPGLLLPTVPVKAVLLLRHGNRPDGPTRTLIFHQADVFLQTDSKTAALMAQILGPSAPYLAEQGLGQVEMFFSALVWYLGQHPDRVARLLATTPGKSEPAIDWETR
ncbi:MAG TPA: hypothetical protein VKU02_17750 [Gemmataceae bacterium]|nr:hypothetical protein [Gemmataceae bacterium]